jgi:phosphoribosylamine--glycine ligase/phosphoribosylformylglycinamidine cyclo-ligase
MKTVLVIGSGGREACVAYAFAKSPQVSKVFVCPGNAGTNKQEKIENVLAESVDNAGFVKVAECVRPDLIFIGPEGPLVEGLVDELSTRGFRCFGPTKRAAELEASKAFSKEFFVRYSLPTAAYRTFSSSDEAKEYVRKEIDWVHAPVVVKASGLCAGKGVFIPDDAESAVDAIDIIMDQKSFGESAGQLVVVEERLDGEEVSVLAFCDGTTSCCMPPAQDHKRVGDGDTGLNTGGMGAYAPAPCVTDDLRKQINDIVQRTLDGLFKDGTPFVGVLFAGLMLTKSGPKLLEYNVRMGDPETQAILPLLRSDLFEICDACISGKLKDVRVEWKNEEHAATVIIASKGYPGTFPRDMPINGLDQIPQNVIVFHAGTKMKGNKVVANGGRVLAVTGLGTSLEDAITRAYEGVSCIHFEPEDSCHYRRDIGHRALKKSEKRAKFENDV